MKKIGPTIIAIISAMAIATYAHALLIESDTAIVPSKMDYPRLVKLGRAVDSSVQLDHSRVYNENSNGLQFYWTGSHDLHDDGLRFNHGLGLWHPSSIDGGSTISSLATLSSDETPAPEPATIFLIGTGLVGFVGVVRKRLHSN